MKREDQLRVTALDMAIRATTSHEPTTETTNRAAAFLSFLRGVQSVRPKKTAKR